MKKISRRNLLKSSAIVAGGSAAVAANKGVFASTRRTSKKAVVIGSGFGGSVAALRLAEAGIPTALVERGRHWKYTGEDSYPTIFKKISGIGKLLWKDPGILPGLTGMLEQYIGTMPVGVGAGLGGGSLVYGGVLLQPRREIFEKALPNLSYDDMVNKYYPKVLSRVSGGPIPDDILNSPNYTSMRVFIENAAKAGMEVVRSEVGFDWNVIREEVEGKREPFASVGDWVFGCNSGAKKTLDRNYIAEAYATGNVEIFTLHNVETIRQKNGSTTFEVHCDVLNQYGFVQESHIIECQYLFVAAGSINSTKLLLKSKEKGDLAVNDGVGLEWGTNGDELMARSGVNASLGEVMGGPPSIAAFDLNNPIKPTGFMHAPNPWNGKTTQLQMMMTMTDQPGEITYNSNWDSIHIDWSRKANQNYHNAEIASMNKMLEYSGGSLVDLKFFGTWHPLGGAVMGTACNELGELYGTPNLFVVDGACIPGSSGAANPSLTIGANAERIMESLIPQLS